MLLLGPSRALSLLLGHSRSLTLLLGPSYSSSLFFTRYRSLSCHFSLSLACSSLAVSRDHSLTRTLSRSLALSFPLAITRSLSLTCFFMTIAYCHSLFSHIITYSILCIALSYSFALLSLVFFNLPSLCFRCSTKFSIIHC